MYMYMYVHTLVCEAAAIRVDKCTFCASVHVSALGHRLRACGHLPEASSLLFHARAYTSWIRVSVCTCTLAAEPMRMYSVLCCNAFGLNHE